MKGSIVLFVLVKDQIGQLDQADDPALIHQRIPNQLRGSLLWSFLHRVLAVSVPSVGQTTHNLVTVGHQTGRHTATRPAAADVLPCLRATQPTQTRLPCCGLASVVHRATIYWWLLFLSRMGTQWLTQLPRSKRLLRLMSCDEPMQKLIHCNLYDDTEF